MPVFDLIKVLSMYTLQSLLRVFKTLAKDAFLKERSLSTLDLLLLTSLNQLIFLLKILFTCFKRP
jgi:hypothetical protein